MTKNALQNAITLIITLGGSTNAVLHLIAMADAVGVEVTLDDFVRIGGKHRCKFCFYRSSDG
jgi:dihydroxy-acid dehydratase